jgi:proteasome lid subunit RPN8/RPN11
MTTTLQIETSSYLTGTRRGMVWTCRMHFLSRGSPVSVEFDWTKVIRREETFRDVLGFFHTHPQGLTRPSRRDVRTMQAWCDCLGKPLLCIIGEPGSADMQIHGYLFRNFRSRGRKVELMARDNQQIVFKE